MWVLTLLLGILVVLIITAFTGYFVAQEFSYMAVDRSRLAARAADGDHAAQRALAVTKRTSFMLSGAQLGITITALLVGYVAEPLIGASLGEALGGVGVPKGVGIAIGTVIALLASTLAQMIFGELFPKNLAIARPEPVAVSLATSTTIYLKVFGWLITIFDKAANLLLRAVRIEPVHDVEHSATVRDLENIVAESRDSGDLSPELSMLLDRILEFPHQDAEHAMIPRARVEAIRHEATLADVWQSMSAGHSRYPVLNDADDVVGVVHLQDVLACSPESTAPVTSIMRDALLVPTSMTLPNVLLNLVTTSNQLACVIDEYGGLAGVLTSEDLAEELVGEIADEHDPAEPDAMVEPEGSWVMAGDLPLDEVERTIGHDLPRDDYETLAGLAIAVHGALPDTGAVVDVALPTDGLDMLDDDESAQPSVRIEVLDVERHVPSRLRLTLVHDDADAKEDAR